jgi:hypothetical protein
MKVAICKSSAHKVEYQAKLGSFFKGIQSQNDDVEYNDYPQSTEYDAAVIYGSYKPARGSLHHKIKTKITKNFKKFVQLETPVIGRSAKTVDHDYLRVGVNGFLFDEAEWGFDHMDKARYKKVFKHTGYDTNQEWKTNGEDILILMQNPGDASLRGQNIFEWALNTVSTLKNYTDRKIVIRPHPLPRKGFDQFLQKVTEFDNVEVVENSLPKNFRPLELDFKNCYCAVSISSGSAVDAVLAGIPHLATDPGNMAWEISTHKLENIEQRYIGDRIDWMQKIAMCQWSVEEFESGECWEHVSKSI